MRYKLDNAGYVCAVSFGCYLDNCTEYTGAVPTGYNNLDEWATYACIQAYYISNGNLTLDSERLAECQNKQVQEAIDYAPLVRKDLYESDEVFDSQYIRQTETGKVIVLKDIKTIAPRVMITNVEPYDYGKLTVYTQGKNMMPCTGKEQKVSGVNFTRNYSGAMSVVGKATANIEYVISECNFTLKANENYYLNLGGLSCELRYIENGEIAQQYVGASGLITVPKNIEVSQVVVKISNGQTVNTTFYPQLEYGNAFTSYAEYKCKSLDIDFSEFIAEALFPDDELYPSDELYPRHTTTINYILIENGSVTVSVDGIPHLISGGAVGLFGSCSTIYANKDVTLEVTYSSKLIAVDSLEFLQGKSTTTNQFKILKDGSIEAHNGYFSGRIEADSGYFKGEININNRFIVDEYGNVTLPSNAVLSWGQITGTDDVANKSDIPTNTNQLENGAGYTTMADVEGKGYTTMSAVEAKGYQNAIQVTQITKDTVTAPFIETLGLTVGNEIKMGPNAIISWEQIEDQPTIPTDTNQLENGAGYTTMGDVEGKGYTTMGEVESMGYQNALQVTQITKDTVTTSFVNALKVKAGSVDAEDITGTTITGKTLKGVTGEFEGKITATSGKIGGFDIGNSSIYSGNKNSIDSSVEGVYLGTDGISIGKADLGPAFKVTKSGDISIKGNGSIEFGVAGVFSNSTYIDGSKVKVANNYIDTNGLHCGGASSVYTKVGACELSLYRDYNSFLTLDDVNITFGTGEKHYIKNSSYSLMMFDTNVAHMCAGTVGVGSANGYLGFFYNGSTSKYSKIQTVAAISTPSSATVATVATKLNELLTALKAYNLIG